MISCYLEACNNNGTAIGLNSLVILVCISLIIAILVGYNIGRLLPQSYMLFGGLSVFALSAIVSSLALHSIAPLLAKKFKENIKIYYFAQGITATLFIFAVSALTF